MARVSVVIPTYNGAHIVGEAIDSVLAQTYRDFEVIVVDDASTDNSLEVLGRYEPRIQVIRRESRGGPGPARNDGIRASRGEYIAFLDHDDLYLPRRLEAAAQFLDENPEFGAVYTDCQHWGPGGRVLLDSMVSTSGLHKRVTGWRDVARCEAMHTDTMTVRRRCFEEIGLLDERLCRGEDDSEFWLRLSYHYPVGQIREVLAIWRRDTGQSFRWSGSVNALRSVRVWEVVLGWLRNGSPADLRFARSRLARAYWLLAVALRAEAHPGALEARRQASSYCLANRLPLYLAAGMVMWHAPALMARARMLRSYLRRLTCRVSKVSNG